MLSVRVIVIHSKRRLLKTERIKSNGSKKPVKIMDDNGEECVI